MGDDTYSLSSPHEKNSRDKIYIWISELTNGTKYLVEGNNIFDFLWNGRERIFIQNKSKITII